MTVNDFRALRNTIIAKTKVSRENKQSEPQTIEFGKLTGFTEFHWKGSDYVRLSKNWALDKNGNRIIIPWDAQIDPYDTDYLHGVENATEDDCCDVNEKPWEQCYHYDGEIRRAMLVKYNETMI